MQLKRSVALVILRINNSCTVCCLSPSQQVLPPKHIVLGAPGRGSVVPQRLCANRLSAWVNTVSVVMFYGEKAFMEDRQQLALLGFTPGFTDSGNAESSCALFTPFLKKE